MIKLEINFHVQNSYTQKGSIFYKVRYKKQSAIINSNVQLSKETWDNIKEDFSILTNPLYGIIQVPPFDKSHEGTDILILYTRISSDVLFLKKLFYKISSATFEPQECTLEDIVTFFRLPINHTGIIEFSIKIISELEKSNQFGTATNYKRFQSSLSQFLNKQDIPIRCITNDIIKYYNTFLERRNICRNSISFYMRIFRALYNKAIDKHIIDYQPTCNLFKGVYTGIDKTHKKAIDMKYIQTIREANLNGETDLEFSRDLFLFSFYTRGMAFIDISYLTKENISNDYIVYQRHKTHQCLKIKIEPKIREIMRKYKDTNHIYIFPIIKRTDPLTGYKDYQKAILKHNLNLKIISKRLHLPISLSSYTPRHSWATIARDNDIPISVISQGMGHDSEKTTQIYLSELKEFEVDMANRLINNL